MTQGISATEPKINPAPQSASKTNPAQGTTKSNEAKSTTNLNPYTQQIHQFPDEDKLKEESASGRLKDFFSGVLKWTSHKAMIAGFGGAALGYMVLGKYLAVPALIFAIPAAIIYFITPKSKTGGQQNKFHNALNEISEAIKDPAKLDTFPAKFKKMFDSLVFEVEKLAPHEATTLFNQIKQLQSKFLNPEQYSPKIKDSMKSVQESLNSLIKHLGIKVNV